MADFNACLQYVLGHEGGYSDHPNDKGGATNKGISTGLLKQMDTSVLKRIGIPEKITPQVVKSLTDHQISTIYYLVFWDVAPFEKIQNFTIAKYFFDMAVHHGISQATKNMQRACNSVYRDEKYLDDDGVFGSLTLQGINQASFSIIPAMISERAGFMRRLISMYPSQRVFLDGWLERAYDL